MGTTDEFHRYDAFISYRHVEPDRRWAKWLHSSLETYRVPKQLVQQRGVPSRIKRIFRDEEELPASADLNQEIETALRESRFLIVVCSPRAVQSLWVNKEVLRFREMGRHDRILALLIEGEPSGSFPPALREIRRKITDELGLEREQIEEVEPLAADVRSSRHEARGHLGRMAKLRLLACVLGCRFDDLRQREQERRTSRLARLGVAATLLVVVMAALAAFALLQRRKAVSLADRNGKLAADNGALAAEKGKLAADNGDLATEKGKIADDLRRTLSVTDARIGHLLMEQGHDDEALPYEARALEEDPSNQTAVTDSMALISGAPSLLWFRHDQAVISAAFSPDGTRVLTASADNTARVWDAATGEPLGERMRHKEGLCSAAFSPDGTRVVTASRGRGDRTARVWDASTGKPLAEPMRHQYPVISAGFSPDGTRVVTGSNDGLVRVWDASTGKLLGEAMQHKEGNVSAAFSPDGTRVVTASNDKTARVWDAATGKPLGEPMRHAGEVYSAAFSPDGTRVVTASDDKTARMWDAATGKPLGEPMLHEGGVGIAAFSPDGTRILTASKDKTLRVWDATTGKPLGEPMRHRNGGDVASAAFSPDGTRVISAGGGRESGEVQIWDAATGKPLGEPMRHEDFATSAAFSPDGTRVVTGSFDKTARVWDVATGKPLAEPMRQVSGFAFGPNGALMFTAIDDNIVRVLDAATGKPLGAPMRHDDAVVDAIFHGMRVVTETDKKTRVWDAVTGKALTDPIPSELGLFAAFSDDGTRGILRRNDDAGKGIMIGDAAMTARVLDLVTGKPLGEPMRHAHGISYAIFSPDGRRVVTVSDDKTARVWDAATGKPLGEPMRDEMRMESADFSPDGARVVTACWDKTRVWDAATGKPLGEPMPHTPHTRTAGDENYWEPAFSPDSSRVVAASDDETARVWDASTGKPLAEPMRHQYPVISADFSPDGTRVVTADGDTVQLWNAATGKPLGKPLLHDNRSAAFSPDGTRVVIYGAIASRVWDVALPVSGSVFLAQLDKLIADRQLGPSGLIEPLADRIALHDSLKRQAESTAATQPSARWMTWFLADHAHRNISPFSEVTVAEWISHRLEENTAEGMRGVREVDPNNARCLARLARSVIGDIPETYGAAVPIYVDLYSRRAVELAPKDAEVLWRRAAMLSWLGRRAEAEKVHDQCPPPGEADLWAWEGKWEACLMLKRDADKDAPLAKARELVKGRIKFIRDSLEENVREVGELPDRPSITQPTTLP